MGGEDVNKREFPFYLAGEYELRHVFQHLTHTPRPNKVNGVQGLSQQQQNIKEPKGEDNFFQVNHC